MQRFLSKLRYIFLIIGTVIGLSYAYSSTGDLPEFFLILPVPLGLIGFALGAIFTTDAGVVRGERGHRSPHRGRYGADHAP